MFDHDLGHLCRGKTYPYNMDLLTGILSNNIHVICEADDPCSVNTAYAACESSFTMSPRSTTRSLHF